MGKVLIEKLLYCCSDLDKIYILIRPKRERTPDIRIAEMFKLPMFQRLRKHKPHMLKKLIPLNGDVTLNNLGLTDEQQECLINETNIVFHCAATLRLEANLKDAVQMNTVGTKRVLELGKKMKKLLAFVHLSTAFCHVDHEELGERVYDAPDDPSDVMRLVQWLDEDAINLLAPKLIAPHPNTYTYSKRLAEKLVADEFPNMPVAIARPSIVTPAFREPMPGWVDNLNGPVGLIVGAGKGVIRSMHCKRDYHAEVIPVDVAINALIGISHKVGSTKNTLKNIPVYNITQSTVRPMTWGEVLEKGKSIAYDYPFENQIWYPDGDIRSSKFIHNLFVFFFHLIPAYLIDFLLLIFGQKRFMVRIQKRISDGLEVLQYFTTRDWVFHNTNMLILWGDMCPKDKDLFTLDLLQIDVIEYMKDIILGARQYCMKEDPSTLPRARIHQRILYFVHVTTIYLFYFGILYFIYKNVEFVRVYLDYFTDKMKVLPLVGSVIEKTHSS